MDKFFYFVHEYLLGFTITWIWILNYLTFGFGFFLIEIFLKIYIFITMTIITSQIKLGLKKRPFFYIFLLESQLFVKLFI